MGVLLKSLLGIDPAETSFERRGFREGGPAVRARLEQVGAAFTAGYHAALEDARPGVFTPRLDDVTLEFRGFAYEGAAMALALLDWLTPWNRGRVGAFLAGAGDPHAYMVHVGAGWALARLPARADRFLARFDPLLRWLLVDGYGFHEAFFHFRDYLAGRPVPSRLQGYARRAFDQGFGRCLWFVEGAGVERIASTIESLPTDRHADLWSGVGLASAYAGGVAEEDLRALRDAAGSFLPELAQGAAFAAKARQRAGNLTPYQDLACGILCGLSAAAAARVTDDALENLPANGPDCAYETWRRRIQRRLTPSPSMVNH
jgi:hypothetical protein